MLDIAVAAGQAASALAPALPFLLQKAGGGAAAEVTDLAKSLWTRLQPKINADPVANQVVAQVAENPNAQGAESALSFALQGLLKSDEALRQQISELLERSERARATVSASGPRAIAVGGNASGSTFITGENNRNTQFRDVTNSQIAVERSSASASGGSDFDAEELFAALSELQAALATSNLPARTRVAAQTAAGDAALEADPEEGQVDADAVTKKVRQIGDTLTKANAVIEQGSSLWDSALKVASALGPLAGGAQTVASWFGIG